MINQALHTLDLLQWICGFPTHVTAHIFNDCLKDVIEVEDTATAVFETPNNCKINFFATTAAGADFPVAIQVKLDNGTLLQSENEQLTCNYEWIPSVTSQQTLGKTVWGTGHKRLIQDFYTCISENRHFPIDFEEGSKVIRLILSMYRSNGNRIAITDIE